MAVITGYVAVLIISQIDNTYLEAIRDTTLKKIMSSDDFQPKYVQGFIHHSERERCNKFMFICLKIVKLVYNSVYFYFAPFLVILINYLSQSCATAPQPEFDAAGNIVATNTLCDPAIKVFYWKDIFVLPLIS